MTWILLRNFASSDAAKIIHQQHKNGVVFAHLQKDLTLLQKNFLYLMAVQDLRDEEENKQKFNALLKVNGVKINDNQRSIGNIKEQALKRQKTKKNS